MAYSKTTKQNKTKQNKTKQKTNKQKTNKQTNKNKTKTRSCDPMKNHMVASTPSLTLHVLHIFYDSSLPMFMSFVFYFAFVFSCRLFNV